MKGFLKTIAVGAVSVGCLVVTASAAFAEKRIALVIGNGAYQHTTPLANPANDAQAMSARFRELGFSVIEGYNLDKMGMDMAIRDFSRESRDSDLNVFFYAGHGMSIDGTNYLVPVDAVFADETALDFEAVKVDFITRQMSYSESVNLVFLDACRDNPLSTTLSRSLGATRSASSTRGLAEMRIQNAGRGMAIAFATSPGEVAQDGAGKNSPFTSALLRHISAENTDITEVFSRVTGDVYEATGRTQRPWLNISLTGSVMLNEVAQAAPVQMAAASLEAPSQAGTPDRMANLEEQKLLFGLAQESGDLADYQTYLDVFPNGLFAGNVQRKIDELTVTRGINTGVAAVAATTMQSANSGVVATYGAANQGYGVTAAPTYANPAYGTPQQAYGAPNQAGGIQEYGPLVLPVTANIRQQIASEQTEAILDLDRTAKGNIQARLNATGNNVGSVDGRWGSKTRRGISNWQAQNGLAPNGFLNEAQLQMLTAQTEGRFTPYTAPVVSSSGTVRRRTTNSDTAAAVLFGTIAGAILSKR